VVTVAYLHVKATVDDFETWKSAFEAYHTRRAEFGGLRYQLYRTTENPNEIVVIIEFDDEESARAWNEYLLSRGELTDPEMRDVEVSYLSSVERADLPTA
jgi:heme-degrading monooxygenase HmoA